MSTRLVQIPTLLIFSMSFIVVAIWYFAVQERRGALDSRLLELEASELEIGQGEASQISAEFVEREIGLMKSEAAFYEDRWALASDSSQLYRRLDRAATDAGVRVVRIEPSKSGVEIRRVDADVTVSGFIIEVQGPFESVLDYIELVQLKTGMTQIKSIRVYPASVSGSKDSSVIASIHTEHIAANGVFESAEVSP